MMGSDISATIGGGREGAKQRAPQDDLWNYREGRWQLHLAKMGKMPAQVG